MSVDEAKAIVLDTCKSPLDMDIAQMRRGLEKWGLTISDFERFSAPDADTFQTYMVWIESGSMDIEQARTSMSNWLKSMPEFPWVGHWDFVVNYAQMNAASRQIYLHDSEFTVRITRFTRTIYHMHGLNIRIPWPPRSRR